MLKITMGFSSGRYSWTESHYLNSSTIPGDPGIGQFMQALAQARVQILGIGAFLTRIRVSEQPANRIVYDYLPPFLPSQSSFPPSIPGTAGYVYNAQVTGLCLVVNLYDSAGRPTRVFLAGLPAGLFTEPSVGSLGYNFAQVPALYSLLVNYMQFLTAPGNLLGWLTRVTGTFVQATGPLVTNAAYPGAVGVTLGSLLVFPAVPRPQVVAKGWRRLSTRSPGVSGVYYVQGAPLFNAGPPPSWTYFLANTGSVIPSNFFTVGGLTVYNPLFSGYNSWQLDEATTRKRGSRFAAPRGRSTIRS